MSLATLLGIEKKVMEHKPKYVALANGADQIVCSCGWESPSVDRSTNFILGRKQRTPDSYFEEHKALAGQEAETTMEDPARERAVTPAQSSKPKKPRR